MRLEKAQRWDPGGFPDPLYAVWRRSNNEENMRGKGSQKQARLERLKTEIVDYVSTTPGVSAADIVSHLSNERKMRNHGLTTRKIGLFIPRHLSHRINFDLCNATGKRIYHATA